MQQVTRGVWRVTFGRTDTPFRRLSDLDLTGVHSITDAAVWQLSRGCPFLQVHRHPTPAASKQNLNPPHFTSCRLCVWHGV